jgi:hypothetical protein
MTSRGKWRQLYTTIVPVPARIDRASWMCCARGGNAFVLHDPNAADFGMRGVRREILPSEPLVNAEVSGEGDWADLVVTRTGEETQ